MKQYDAYAATYDRSGQLRFSILMDVYLRDLLRVHQVPGLTMVDLACGTGTLALLMAERGWQVLALDQSAAMLAEAEQKRATVAEPVTVQFGQADMRDFILPAPVDLVTCCYDTLNYLTAEAEFARCLRSVARALVTDGLFCFDLATDYFLRHYWQGVEFEEFDDYSQVMHSHYDAATGHSTLVLTGFTATGPSRYRRFREVHVERAYADSLVCQLLVECGFTVEAVYDCFTLQPPNERSLRLMYVARRGMARRKHS